MCVFLCQPTISQSYSQTEGILLGAIGVYIHRPARQTSVEEDFEARQEVIQEVSCKWSSTIQYRIFVDTNLIWDIINVTSEAVAYWILKIQLCFSIGIFSNGGHIRMSLSHKNWDCWQFTMFSRDTRRIAITLNWELLVHHNVHEFIRSQKLVYFWTDRRLSKLGCSLICSTHDYFANYAWNAAKSNYKYSRRS